MVALGIVASRNGHSRNGRVRNGRSRIGCSRIGTSTLLTIYTWGWAAVSTKYGTYFPVDAELLLLNSPLFQVYG
jgi:hypothetical protein